MAAHSVQHSRLRPLVALASVEQGWADDEDAPALLAALDRAGVDAAAAMWDDPEVAWQEFDLVVIRSTWDYTERPEEFLTWARRVEQVTRLANPADVVAWNIDKRYLGELAAAGIPVVPTAYLHPGADSEQIADVIPEGTEVVVKPTISAGSRDTARHPADRTGAARDHATALLGAGRSVMVQPYLRSVDELGETGIVCFDGAVSHAFRKGPLLRPGSPPPDGVLFVPEDIEPRSPRSDEVALAEQVLQVTQARLGVTSLLYARVDVVLDDHDRPTLMELELTEPSFFLATDPGAATRAAEAIASLARSGRADGAALA